MIANRKLLLRELMALHPTTPLYPKGSSDEHTLLMSCLQWNSYIVDSSPYTRQKMASLFSGAIIRSSTCYAFLIVCNFSFTFFHENRILLVLSAGFFYNKQTNTPPLGTHYLFIGVTNATRLGPWAGSRRKFNKYSQTK
jgi:hypothetical protein